MTLDRNIMPAAGPEPHFAPPIPARHELTNGLSVLVAERPHLPMVAVGLLLRAGSTVDPADGPGLTSLAATMLREGTASRTSQQISDEMEQMGSAIRVRVHQEFTLISAQALEPQWKDAFGVLADIATSPSFPAGDLERVRRQRLTDLARITDDPTAVARRACRAILHGASSAYGHPGSGTETSVAAFARSDLQRQYGRVFGPAGATLVVTGQVRADSAVQLAESLLGSWRPQDAGPSVPAGADGIESPDRAIYLSDRPGAAQSVIRSGQAMVSRHSPDYLALVLMNQVLGGEFSSRLNMNLRQDKGYSYGYMSGIEWMLGPSALYAGGSVQTPSTAGAVAESLREHAEIRGKRPVEEREHDDALRGLLRGFPSGFETQAQIASQLAQLARFSLPDDYFSKLPGRLAAVTLTEVREAAADRLSEMPDVVVVVGDHEVTAPELKDLGLPVVPIDAEGHII